MKRWGIVLAGALAPALALPLSAPAQADESERRTSYRIQIERQATGQTKEVTLFCGPDGGTHPDPAGACTLIEEFGSIADVDVRNGFCPAVHDPMTAKAWGAEHYRQDFSNLCLLLDAKGAVFDLWSGGNRAGDQETEGTAERGDAWVRGYPG
ncbi:SSI family serine proteinase inhibitor [Nocardiopsis sp. CNT312]|uniref:SSI family serine proteinase inhibitor n=1 Tax=Nocardiopsis sp. CNT312 TaxID=1137268 RepID=UPI0004B709DE|nr:SSI family serine proteinase inhibitor [Nocardiopsis sp. CNT312]